MFTVHEITKSTKGIMVQGEASTVITGVSIDSRKIKKGDVFVAIEGKRFDGHHFVHRAIRQGAKAVIASKRVVCPGTISVIRVQDTTRSLGRIAALYRRRFDIPIIAVTGSTGKTTTKEMIASVLAARFKVLKNIRTENNQYGVPLTLLKLNASHQIAVLELGTNQPGEIRRLAAMTRPTTAVFTNIGDSHLERLRSRRGVFLEKVQLIKYLKPRSSIFFNDDDRYLKTIWNRKCDHHMIRFGYDPKVDYSASHVVIQNNRRLQFKVNGHAFMMNNPAIHNIYNALAAISCGRLHKIRYNDIRAALARFKFRDARQEITRVGRFWLIDDTYNANPLSFESAIHTLNTLQIKGKRIVVCADMLELGTRSRALHQSVGRMIARSAAEVVLTTGRQARYIAKGLGRSNGRITAVHCHDVGEMHRRLKGFCRPGDAVLVKGSRGMGMERTVKFLKERLRVKS